MNLQGRVALVTGASHGIGPFIAEALARRGARLALVARSRDELDTQAARIDNMGGSAIAMPADLLKPHAADDVVRNVEQRLGAVDMLVNNAGLELVGPLEELDPEAIDRILALNLRAPLAMAHAALPGMIRRRRGHIVNMASLAGHLHPPFYETYVATKAGVIGFSHSLRRSLRGTGVSASVIVPGFVTRVGMRRYTEDDEGVGIPAMAGGKPPEAVARAVVRAIRRDRAEIVVAPLRTKLALWLLGGTSFRQTLLAISGVDAMYRRLVQRRGHGFTRPG
ncbi:MAG TPA: SDR family NAD(P)-dependent oxidoreductase [Longimicrobiales bacterium]|nr:SDR family NAD(P)-dependent oxidoreductase [Longimicrobiales bacterium]